MILPIDIDFHLLFLTSFFIFGLNYVTDYQRNTQQECLYPEKIILEWKNLLWFLRFYSIKTFGQKLSQPLFTCVVCMSSAWGSLFYVLFSPTLNVQSWVVQVVALAGLNRLLKSFA